MYNLNAVSHAVLSALYRLTVTGAMVGRIPSPAAVAAIGFPTLTDVDGAMATCGGLLTIIKGGLLADGVKVHAGSGMSPEQAYLNWKLNQ